MTARHLQKQHSASLFSHFLERYSAWDANMHIWMKQKALLSSLPTWMYLLYKGKQHLLHNKHTPLQKLINNGLNNSMLYSTINLLKSSQAYRFDISCFRKQDMWEPKVAEILSSALTWVSHLWRHNISTAQSCVFDFYIHMIAFFII